MKRGSIFWGILMVVFGSLFLINNTIGFAWDWSGVWAWWPLVLIALGVSMFFKGEKWSWAGYGFAATLFGVMLFALFHRGCNVGDHESSLAGRQTVTQKMDVPFDSAVRTASLSISMGAGTLVLRDTTLPLFAVDARSSVGRYELTREILGDKATLQLFMEDNHVSWKGGKLNNAVLLGLNTAPAWDVDLDIGAAEADLDFSKVKLTTLSLDAGAASIKVRLGEQMQDADVSMDVGASNVVIYLPESLGCEVESQTALASTFFEGMTEESEGRYVSPNYHSAPHKVRMRIDGGVSSIKVKRYSGKDF